MLIPAELCPLDYEFWLEIW